MLVQIKATWAIFLLTLFIAMACTEDEPTVSSEPVLDIQSTVIGLPGETFTMTGLLSDPAGIRSIRLNYDNWSLDKIITPGGGITQYELRYSFKVPDSEEAGSSHTIGIEVTNAGGNVSAGEVLITLSKDNEEPQIAFSSPNDGGTYILGAGPEFNLSFGVTDNHQIESVELIGLGFNEVVRVNSTNYSFDQEIDFALAGSFEFTIIATDSSGNRATSNLVFNIEESLKFDKMYLADVGSEGELSSDAFGVPARINGFTHPDSAGVIFEALYYNSIENTGIRFIPQKSSFAPFSFGAGANAGELAMGSDASVDPIVLPNVGYYRVVLNLTSLSYTMETYSPSDTPFDQVYLMGTGVRVNGESTCVNNNDASELCWNFASGKALNVDGSNPYLFTATIELFDHDPVGDGNNGFILGANPDGWSPFWRFDQGDVLDLEPEFTVLNDGSNYIFSEAKYGTYQFEFDTHLNRVKLVPQ